MDEAWFTGMADELARCLVDARACAATGEAVLDELRLAGDPELLRVVLDALVAPVAVSHVLVDLLDHPPQLALAAARLLRDSSDDAAHTLATVADRIEVGAAISALRSASESSDRLLDAAG